jgi:hypothetical protein
MKIPAPIPEKISINLLYEYLGLSAMSQDAKLEALKSYSKDSGLLFTFDEALKGIPVDIPLSEIYDEADEFKPAKCEYIQCIFKPKSFTLNDYSIGKGKAFTCIRQFEVSEVGFNIINKDKSNFGSYDVDLAKVYVKKTDFINFMNESGDNALSDLPTALQPARATKACISTPRQEVLKLSPLDQRYEFLKEWTQKTLQGVPFDEFIAEYDIELTKETFYDLLSNEYQKSYPNDSNIFARGKGDDEFYKDKRITLKFKGGRRKNS